MTGDLAPRPPGGPGVPQGGAFAVSEVLPLLRAARDKMDAARTAWEVARTTANEAKAHARKTRADLIVRLRVYGNDDVGVPIRTSAERNEWADADADVQQTELAADLAQTVAMAARAAFDTAVEEFGILRTMLGMERDQFKADRGEA